MLVPKQNQAAARPSRAERLKRSQKMDDEHQQQAGVHPGFPIAEIADPEGR